MIQKNEFRIGNLFQDDEGIFPITKAFFQLLDFNLKDTCPIMLTEEWLLKLGFEKIVYDSEETGCGTDYHLKCNGDVFMCYSDDFSLGLFASEESMKKDLGVLPIWKNTNTVHGLQNLHFALTGTELTLIN